jgi:hypothetical protein
MFGKVLNDISIKDIETVVQNRIPESRTLDYKLDVHPEGDAGNKEFLKDISAFANTAGGYLIYGVEEKKGIPAAIKGVEVDDFDKLRQRFDNLLRTGVDPPIRGVEFRQVDFTESKKIIVVRVSKSVARPHVVKIKEHFRFYGRSSSGVHPLEVDDLRRAFLASETLATRIRTFRNDRIAQIACGQMPIPMPPGAKTVLHLMPVSAFELGREYDLTVVSSSDMQPINVYGWDHRRNYDGFVSFSGDRNSGIVESYAQLFRNGIIEAVEAGLLRPHEEKIGIPSIAFEARIVEAFNQYITLLCRLGVDFPVWVGLSLLDVKGYWMFVRESLWHSTTYAIDREELVIPEVAVEGVKASGENVLKPAFDAIWNACGYKCSLNYDEDGNWKLKGE